MDGFGTLHARCFTILRRLVVAVMAAVVALLPSQAGGQDSSPATPAQVGIPAVRKATNVAIITIKGEINEVTARSVERRITMAENAGADAIVFELDTPGGEVPAALMICGMIKNCPIPNTIAWVNPQAYSAGSIIALACREIVTSPAADFGDALPIRFDPIRGLKSLREAERQKITAPLIAEVVDSARTRGYDEMLVQGFVSLGVELWLVEHRSTGERMCVNRAEYRVLFGAEPTASRPRVASAPVPDAKPAVSPTPDTPPRPESPPPATDGATTPEGTPAGQDSPAILDPERKVIPASPSVAPIADAASARQSTSSKRKVISAADRGQWTLVEYVADGNGPITLKADDMKDLGLSAGSIKDDEELKQFLGARNLRRLDASWSEGLVAFLTNMIVRAVLIVIMLIALFIEMTHPGVMLPGVVAFAALFALIAPPMLIGMASWWELAAIVSGILLILLEIFVIPGFGVPGIVGIVLLFAGLVGTFVPSGGGLFPDSPQARGQLLYGATTVLLSATTAVVAMYFIGRHLGSLPLIGRLVLKSPEDDEGVSMLTAIDPSGIAMAAGMTGVTITPLRPSGRAQFGDRIVDVVAELGWVESGTRVRVVQADAFRVAVEPIRDGNAPGDRA